MNMDLLLKNMQIETLLLIFFNSIKNNNNDFEIQSRYKQSKFLPLDLNSYFLTAKNLQKKYNLNFEVKNTIIYTVIKNDFNISLDEFLNLVYKNIIIKINDLPNNYQLDVEIAFALFILRGSVDFNRSFYSVDLKLKDLTHIYVNNFFKILLSSDDLISKLNLNFRELQYEYISGKSKRNTQVRINLRWFFDNVIKKYKHINQYKSDVLFKHSDRLGEEQSFNLFEKRLFFYKTNILNKKLNNTEVSKLRESLSFQNYLGETNFRNQKIIIYAREVFEDICVGCNDKYDIKDRSFLMPKNNRYYLEINHVLSYANDSKKFDVLDNLVKLCPVCHRALTPGRADPELQKDIINKMINSRQEVKDFIDSVKPSNYISSVDYVFDNLK